MTAPDDALAALLDVAAIEARAAAATPGAPDDRAWGPHVARWRDSGSLNPYADDLAHAVVEQEQTLALICEDNAMLLAALRTLTAQHAADVAAAVAGERERAVAVCRAVADGWERASTTAKVDTGLALIRAEGATECADAIAAPTGGGE